MVMVQGLPKAFRVSFVVLLHDITCVSTKVQSAMTRTVPLLSLLQCMLDMTTIPVLLQCDNHPATQMQQRIFCCCSM